MIRRPPRSTLFPLHDALPIYFAPDWQRRCEYTWRNNLGPLLLKASAIPSCGRRGRSEEHTSELQSRLHLVCRLLLEKKKSTWASSSTGSCTPTYLSNNNASHR